MDHLLASNYGPLLTHGYDAVSRIAPPAKFRVSFRSKGVAVSDDGKIFRMSVSANGYQDRFVRGPDATVVLEYVCGLPEERRRQNLNSHGDAVTVILDDRPTDTHAFLQATFLGICVRKECKADGTEMLTARSRLRIDAVRHSAHSDQTAAPARPLPDPGRQAVTQHLFVDTESAAPFSRTKAHRHRPFPFLQFALFRTSGDFQQILGSADDYALYPPEHRGSLGNDASSSVLKVPLGTLAAGLPVDLALGTLHAHLCLVCDSGGFLFAHNVRHDLEQILAAAQLVGYKWPRPLRLWIVDTVKTSSNFVPGAQDCWMKLGDLADACGVAPSGALHDARTDAKLLMDIVAAHYPRGDEALRPFAEEFALDSGM